MPTDITWNTNAGEPALMRSERWASHACLRTQGPVCESSGLNEMRSEVPSGSNILWVSFFVSLLGVFVVFFSSFLLKL